MSSEKGGALVRSPPAIVGVDTYKSHVAGSPPWDHQTPQIPPQKLQQQPQHMNASVTKLSPGDSGISRFGHGKQKERKHHRLEGNEDIDQSCNCGGWARARQLSHDIHRLRQAHETVLSGLHYQVEELKLKNRDLIFQLLMGPLASEVRVGVPLSPESDVTSPKESVKLLENKSTSTSENEQEGEFETEVKVKPLQFPKDKKDEVAEAKGQLVMCIRPNRSRTGDPRQVRSLDLEMLEEEAQELRRQLDEEKGKNTYLAKTIEDLKKQIRDQAANWHQFSPNVNRNGSQYKKSIQTRQPSENSTNELTPQDTSKTFKDANEDVTQPGSSRSPLRSRKVNQRKTERSSERKTTPNTTLPSIVQPDRAREPLAAQNSPQVPPTGEEALAGKEAYPAPRQRGKGKLSHRTGGGSHQETNTDDASLSERQPHQRERRRGVSPRQENASPSRMEEKTQMSPSSRRRAATNRLTRTRASPRTSPHLESIRSLSREPSRNRKPTSDSSPMRRADQASLVNGEISQSNGSPDHAVPKTLQRARVRAHKASSSERREAMASASASYNTSDGAMASSSSSIGSMPSTVNRPKHRGKAHRRSGRGKNKKEPLAETNDSKLTQ